MKKHLVTLFLSAAFVLSSAQANAMRTLKWSELEPPSQAIDLSLLQEENPKMSARTDLPGQDIRLDLIGQDIRIPGYVVPLEGDDKKITEFLLVPYFGACTHVPPPPPNQIILVKVPKGVPFDQLYGPVWVEGKLNSESTENDIAPVGYSLIGSSVEMFE